jgi:hypothetical protein
MSVTPSAERARLGGFFRGGMPVDMLDELGQKEISVQEFLDDMRYVKGYSSILSPLTDEYIKTHNRTFFYDGDILEYQVGTSRVVKAVVDGDSFEVKKDGIVYNGEKARALFKDDSDFKKWKKTCDGEKNALISDACAKLEVYQYNHVYVLKELQLPKEFKFCTVQEMMTFLKSREFEAVQARYLPQKDASRK